MIENARPQPGPNQNTLNRGLAFLVISALCWSLNSPLIKSLSLDPFLLTGMRALIAGIALAPCIRPRRIHWSINAAMMLLFYLLHCTLLVIALRTTSAPIAVAMQYTAPVWLFLWAHKKGEKVQIKRIWPLCVMLCAMILFMFSKGTGITALGNIVAACSSLTFAALTYFSKRSGNEASDPLSLTAIANILTACTALLIAGSPFAKIAAISPAQWPILLVLGIVQTAGGYAFYFIGLKDVDATTATMISPLEMVLGPIWVALFLHEYTDVIGLIAFILVITGVLGEILVTKKAGRETAVSDRAPNAAQTDAAACKRCIIRQKKI